MTQDSVVIEDGVTVEDVRLAIHSYRQQGGIPHVCTGRRPSAESPMVWICGSRVELIWEVGFDRRGRPTANRLDVARYMPRARPLLRFAVEPLGIEVLPALLAAERALA